MSVQKTRSVMVAENVYFYDFHAAAQRTRGASPLVTVREIRLTAETLQTACRDLISGAPALVRRAELNVADLVSVASMIDELAFQAHIMALEGDGIRNPAVGREELQRLLLEGAEVTAELQACMSEAVIAAESFLVGLRAQAERALQLGRSITQTLDSGMHDETPAAP